MPKTAWAARTPAIDASRVLLIEVVINFVLLAVVRFSAVYLPPIRNSLQKPKRGRVLMAETRVKHMLKTAALGGEGRLRATAQSRLKNAKIV